MLRITARSTPLGFALSLALLLHAGAPRCASAQTPAQVGSWGPVLNWGVQGKHLVVLPTSNVLVWPTGNLAKVWNPTTGTFISTPATFGDLHCAAQALLPDGRAIVVGGVNGPPHVGIKVTALFDPFSNTWSEGTTMNYARWYGTATVLPDGRLLASSGDDQDGNRVKLPEIYDPVANTWTILSGATRNQGLYPFMYVLPNGKVYEAGTFTNTALLDFTGAGSWSAGPSNPFGSSSYAECDVMYGTGKILRTGGGDPAWARASVIDMTAPVPAWREIAPMSFTRRRHNLVMLLDGNVLAVGGTGAADDEAQARLNAELWNPATETWSTMAAASEARMYHSAAVLLPDGRVVSSGGETSGRLHAQIYSPPYLFKGARPIITSSPTTAAYGTAFNIPTPDAASIDRVALIRSCAATHAIDMNERYVPLTYSVSGGNLVVNAPANANLAPPGYYLLVIRNTTGVPSVANWIRIGSAASLTPGLIVGRVTAASGGAGITGASVSYNGGSTTTNGTGNYTLAGVPAGQHNVTASKTGYANVSTSVNVAPGDTTFLDFQLSPPGTISGHVRSAINASPIANADVYHGGGTVRTDAAGLYTITGLAPGNQNLTVNAFGYLTADSSITVVSGTTQTLDFALEPELPFITGEILNGTTLEPIVGANVSYSGGSVATDNLGRYKLADVAPGNYTVTAEAAGFITEMSPVVVAQGGYTALDFALTPVPSAPGVTRTFTPIADSDVQLGTTNNSGTAQTMRVRFGSPEYRCYLKFLANGFAGAVTRATLRLFCTDSSDEAGSLYRTGNGWTELTINGINAPTFTGTALAAGGVARLNTWVEFDVTSQIVAGDTISFGLKTLETNSAYYSTREGAQQPQLVVTFAGYPSVASFSPTSGTPGTEVTVIGGNFTGASIVRFNGTPAPGFIIDNDAQIRATVPAGATSGRVGVTNAVGAALSGSTQIFSVVQVPAIAAFYPLDGPAGTMVTIEGSGFSTATSIAFNGRNSGMVMVMNDSLVHTTVPAGASSGPITVTSPTGTGAGSRSFLVTSAPNIALWNYSPTEDAQVSELNPTSHYGALTTLRAKAGEFRFFIKFNVQSLTDSVQSAKLRLYVTDPSPIGGTIFLVSNDYLNSFTPWTEAGITSDTAPAMVNNINTLGNAALDTWVEFDVKSAVTGNGPVSFGVSSTTTNSVFYSSKEGANPPVLEVKERTSLTPTTDAPPGPRSSILEIHPARPNPFRQGTMIEYGLPRSGHVHLAIYSVTGQVVRRLADGFQVAGTRQAAWNGLDDRGHKAAPGLYLYRVQFEGESRGGKLMLLR